MEEDGAVALLFEEIGETRSEDGVGVCLGGGLDEVGFYAAVDRDARLGGVRDGRVVSLGEEAALG